MSDVSCIDCGRPTPYRECKQCRLMREAEERAREQAREDENDE